MYFNPDNQNDNHPITQKSINKEFFTVNKDRKGVETMFQCSFYFFFSFFSNAMQKSHNSVTDKTFGN